MYGIDIYSGDKGINLASGDYQFAIIKATEGRNYVDSMFNEFASTLSVSDKLIGCYHYARPDKRVDVDDAKKEIDDFLEAVEQARLLGKAILAIDWEQSPTDRLDMLKGMCEHLVQTSGIIPFIYSSLSFFKKYQDIEFLGNYPHWVAYWTKIGTVNVGTRPSGMELSYPYTIWQYTENGKYPNFSGKIDLNYTSLSTKTWAELCKPKFRYEVLSEQMKWAIVNGLFIGYGDGTYRPDENVTRGQLATVLNRFYNKFIKGEKET